MSAASARPTAFWLCLFGALAAGFALRFGLALAWPTVERPDEVFQNLEPAYRLATGRGVVTWEWREGIRSWLMPGALGGLMRLVGAAGLPGAAMFAAIAAVLSVVAAGTIAIGVELGWRRYGLAGAALCGVLTACWPDLIYFGPKALGEVQAGNLLAVAAGLALLPPGPRDRLRLLAIGALLGLAFDLRFQLAPALLLVAAWPTRLDLRRWAVLAGAALVPVLAAGALDWATLGTPFQSVWKNFAINLLQNRAEFYGVSPVWSYLAALVVRFGPSLLIFGALFALGARRAPLLALTAAVVIASHSAIGHKELSFVYAAAPLAVIATGLGAADLLERLPILLRRPPAPGRALRAAVAIAVLALGAGLAEHPFQMGEPQASLAAMWGYAHAAPDLCGLALYSDDPTVWARTPGAVGLARPVAISLPLNPAEFAASRGAFNYAVAPPWRAGDMAGFEPVRCRRDYCLFHRPDRCFPDPAHEISNTLARIGQ